MKSTRTRKYQAAFGGLTAISAVALTLLCGANVSAQCAMCRTALTQSAEGERWSRGINAGIMMLLAAPFLIAGSILLVIYHAHVLAVARRLRARFIPGGAYRKPEVTTPTR